MNKDKTITQLTPAACEAIQSRMLDACQKVAADLGLVIESGGWRPTESIFSFGSLFRISIPAPDGSVFDLEKERFIYLARQYGLSPEDFQREFSTGGERFRITGIDPRRPRYPISVERIPDRKGYKFTAENVVVYLQKRQKP